MTKTAVLLRLIAESKIDVSVASVASNDLIQLLKALDMAADVAKDLPREEEEGALRSTTIH